MARPLTVTAFGNAQVDTSFKKSGTGSLKLDGVDDYLTVDQPDGELNIADNLPWTVETWAYWVGGVNADYPIVNTNIVNSTSSWALTVANRTSAVDRIEFVSSGLGGIEYAAHIQADEWHHIAIVCDGTNVYIYLDGTNVAGPFTGNTSIQSKTVSTNNDLIIGIAPLTPGSDYNGWLDEFKISNVARYSANFIPKSVLGTDSNTLLHLQMDGTNGSTTFVDDVGVNGAAIIDSSFTINKADGRTFLRADANLSAFASQLTVQNPAPSMVYLENDVFTWENTDTWDTIYDSDDKWAVWERLNSSFAITVIGSDFDIASSQQFGEFTLSATGGTQKNASANLADAFTQSVRAGFLITIDDPYDYTWDTIPEDQWNGFFTDQWRPDGWFAFDQVTLTGLGGLELNASAEFSSQANLEIAARLSDVRGAAEFAAAFTQTSGSDVYRNASANLEAFATELVVARLSDVRGSADLTAEFTLTSGSDNSKSGQADLTAQADLSAVSTVDHTGSALLASEFALESQSRILKLANLDITSLGDMTVAAVMTYGAASQLQCEFAQTTRGGYQLDGQSNLSAEFTSIINGSLIPSVDLDEVAFTADLAANGVMIYGAGARLEAFASELTAGERLPGGKANLAAEFTTVVTGSAVFSGSALLEAFVSQLSAGRISDIRGSARLDAAFTTQFAGELKLLDSQFIYRVLEDTRTISIESEIRKYMALPENRLFGIDPESRDYQVLPENRTVEVGYFMQ